MKNEGKEANRKSVFAKIYEKLNDMFKSYERAVMNPRIAGGYYYVPYARYFA